MAVMGALGHISVLRSTDQTCRNWWLQWLRLATPALRKLRWKDQYFRASLGYIVKPCQKVKPKQNLKPKKKKNVTLLNFVYTP